MKKARAAEAQLRVLTKMHRIIPERVRAVQIACVQAIALYGSELWWDPREIGRREDIKLPLNRQAISTLGALPTTPMGALMRESGLTPVAVVLDARQQRFTARLASPCEGSKPQAVHDHPTSGAPICRVITKEHERGREAETISWPSPEEEPAGKTVILSKDTAAKREAIRWAREREAKVGAGIWMWWTDGSRSDDGRVGAAAVWKHGDRWEAFRSHLGTGQMKVHDAELWAIGLAVQESVRNRDTLRTHGVMKVAVFSDSHAAIRRTEHLEPGPGQPLARWINQSARTFREVGIETEIHWVPGHTGIAGNEEADRQANPAREGHRTGTVRERVYTSAANRTRRISEAKTAAKAEWEADKCSKHHGYRLKGKAGSKRPIPMNSVKPLAARFYRLKSGNVPVGTYLKRFGHRDDDKCWWCSSGGKTTQTRDHLFRHCSRLKVQQKTLWKEVGKATGWRVGRCRQVKVSELLSIEKCDKAVMDFLAATDVGKFPPKMSGGASAGGQRAEEKGLAGSL